jgi:hypothetical protein
MIDFLMFCTEDTNVDNHSVPMAVKDKTKGQFYVDCGDKEEPVSQTLASMLLKSDRYRTEQVWAHCGVPASGIGEDKQTFAVVVLHPQTVNWIQRLSRIEGLPKIEWTEDQQAVLRAELQKIEAKSDEADESR